MFPTFARNYLLKNIFFIFIFLPVIFFSQIPAKVIAIYDGDTITVLLENKTSKKLRLAEVDCPERGQPFGKNAKQFISDQIFGKQITFVETDIDRYGRSIAKVYYDNQKYLSSELIKSGLGWWYFYYSKDKSLGKLEEEARQNKIGLWQDKNAIAPWEFRKIEREK